MKRIRAAYPDTPQRTLAKMVAGGLPLSEYRWVPRSVQDDIFRCYSNYATNRREHKVTDTDIIKLLMRYLETASERFTDPTYGCVWLDAAEACDEAVRIASEHLEQ
jgi:hypothetical protein